MGGAKLLYTCICKYIATVLHHTHDEIKAGRLVPINEPGERKLAETLFTIKGFVFLKSLDMGP